MRRGLGTSECQCMNVEVVIGSLIINNGFSGKVHHFQPREPFSSRSFQLTLRSQLTLPPPLASVELK